MSEENKIEMSEREKKIFKAVRHVLEQICCDERKAYFLGFGTESLRLLIEAYAAGMGKTPEDVKKEVEEELARLPIKKFSELIRLGEQRSEEWEKIKERKNEADYCGGSAAMSIEEFIGAVENCRVNLLPDSSVMAAVNPEHDPVGIVGVNTRMIGERRVLEIRTY